MGASYGPISIYPLIYTHLCDNIIQQICRSGSTYYTITLNNEYTANLPISETGPCIFLTFPLDRWWLSKLLVINCPSVQKSDNQKQTKKVSALMIYRGLKCCLVHLSRLMNTHKNKHTESLKHTAHMLYPHMMSIWLYLFQPFIDSHIQS